MKEMQRPLLNSLLLKLHDYSDFFFVFPVFELGVNQ